MRWKLLLLVLFVAQAQQASAQSTIPTRYISVGDYSGTANERIDAAIAAAMATDHKTVFFPNGTYALRNGLNLNRGANTELHLVGESRNGVFLVPDTSYLEANYNNGNGARLAHMINLSSSSVFESVDVSIQNMTVDMRHQLVMGEQSQTYNVVGHGIRVGTGWQQGQLTVNEVTIRNVGSYGIGIQDRDGHSKNNVTLSNLTIERTGSDGIDTKEASGDGNRNLVIRNVNINEVGFLDTGAAPAIDVRYRDFVIENVNLVSSASKSTLPGQSSNVSGISIRPVDNIDGGVAQGTISDVYLRGFSHAIVIHASEAAPHANIDVSDVYIQGQQGTGILVLGDDHSGHTITDGLIDPDFGNAAINTGGNATVTNVIAGRRDPALTPITDTTYENNVSLNSQVFSPAWQGIVGTERVSLNPTSPSTGPFVFDIGDTGVLQIDFDTHDNVMDRLSVEGTVNLDGEFRVNLVGGTPMLAGEHWVIGADTLTGSFDEITLPTPSSRLLWNTDRLETQGIIELVGGNFLLLGDVDNFSYNASDDAILVDPAFASLPLFNGAPLANMDQTFNNATRLFTFDLGGELTEELIDAWLEIRVRQLNGFGNDLLTFEDASNRSLRSLEVLVDDGVDRTLRYTLTADELALLNDGLFSVALRDDHAIDWIGLGWSTIPSSVPEPSSLSLLSCCGLVMFMRRRRALVR
ncbi:glycosyl hydrolase family 28-related protein [Stieleria varia]|uniref:glycosyl hydrolase family 28-related protein n=1 Tax=Stieleria varia TaxID=2528005 RepID=UPI0018D215A1|nr:glycosyl hydrolase family 28-related protein [Stieleria varia]